MNARQLQSYLVQQVLQHQADIAPEILTDYVGGDSKAAIDRSIQQGIAASQALVERARAELARPSDQDHPGFVTQVREGYGDIDPQSIADLDMEGYAKLRSSLGIGQGQGIFGPIGR
jgi:hypothetical protein